MKFIFSKAIHTSTPMLNESTNMVVSTTKFDSMFIILSLCIAERLFVPRIGYLPKKIRQFCVNLFQYQLVRCNIVRKKLK